MIILDRFEEQAIENVIEGSEFREIVLYQLGYAENNFVPGNFVGNSAVEIELDYQLDSRDEDLLNSLILEDPDIVSLEKAIRSGNDDLAEELAENIFDNSADEFKLQMEGVVDKKVEFLKQRFNELVNEQEVYMMGYVSTTMTLFELYGERDYDEVSVDIYLGWDFSYFYDKARYVIGLVSDNLNSRGLLDEPVEEDEE